jgi:hypothetical protein
MGGRGGTSRTVMQAGFGSSGGGVITRTRTVSVFVCASRGGVGGWCAHPTDSWLDDGGMRRAVGRGRHPSRWRSGLRRLDVLRPASVNVQQQGQPRDIEDLVHQRANAGEGEPSASVRRPFVEGY